MRSTLEIDTPNWSAWITDATKVLRSGTFWLSETPGKAGSRGWDAACNRVVTWAEFKDKITGKHFMVFNTHFDHIGEVARVESARLINRKIAELAHKLPVVLTGDFNVSAKHRAYNIITYPENEYVLADSRQRAMMKTGPDVSWVSFDPNYNETDLIDFIFTTLDIEVLSNSIYDFRPSRKFLSDHLPVTAVLKFR
jgi:endonuclease/exonuclease/phosphatase family metal-dependent hydrolase